MNDTPTARRRQILELLDTRRMLTVQELVAELGVSAMTVHRDLDRLAADGYLTKTRGGATLPSLSRPRFQRRRSVRHVQPSSSLRAPRSSSRARGAAVCAHVARIAAWRLLIWVIRPT